MEYNEYRDEEALRQLAESHDCDLLIPSDNQFFFDLDDEEAETVFLKNFTKFAAVVPLAGVWTYRSKSGRGKHIIATSVYPYRIEVRIAYQAMLGSDRVKEVLSMNRWMSGSDNVPICLFRPRSEEITTYRIEPEQRVAEGGYRE